VVDRIITAVVDLRLAEKRTSTTVLGSITANAASLLTSRTLGNSIVEGRTYNSRNQLTGITAGTSGSLLNLGYGYTASGGVVNDGRIRSRTDSVQPKHSAAYTFDSLHRLTDVLNSNPSWEIGWVYDNYGNRTSQTPYGLANTLVGLGTQSISYSSNRNSALTYDSAGDVTNDGVNSYAYDGEGRLKSVGGGAITYDYDGDNQMIRRSTSSLTTYYLYGQTGLLSEFSTVNSGATAAASTNRLEYRVNEQTATPVLLMNSSGLVTENNRVLPFGEQWQLNSLSANSEKFTTYFRDPITGNDYAMDRHYQNAYGRFLSPDRSHLGQDPEAPQSWNMYAYTMADPINLTDPSGDDTCEDLGLGPCGASVTVTSSPLDDGEDEASALEDLEDFLSSKAIHDELSSLQSHGLDVASQVAQSAANWLAAPRDKNCVNALTASFSALGAAIGAAAGTLGLAGGPAVLATEPGAIAFGGATGAVVGNALGMISCMGSSVGGGGGSGRSSGGSQDKKLTPGEIAKLKANRINPEALKEEVWGRSFGRTDLYKTLSGDIVIKGKGGVGPGEPTGININHLK